MTDSGNQRPFHVPKSVLDELRRVSETEDWLRRCEKFVEADDISLNCWALDTVPIGKLSDLPLWAQSYIKQLRRDLFEERNPR